MAKYMIHACNNREWYVNQYLIPSMLKQGIKREDIILHLDINNKGNLESCMSSFRIAKDFDMQEDGIWHIQDDVIISSEFRKRTEELDSGLVCGFCCDYDSNKQHTGVVRIVDMWYSFPCIRIPNKLAVECAEWYYTGLTHPTEIKYFARNNKNDDLLFKAFLERFYMKENVILVTPNLVDHVDWLIGGSIINKQRDKIIRALYWEESELVTELERQLKENNQ